MAMWLAICQLLYGIKSPASEKISTTGCTSEINVTDSTYVDYNTVIPRATETFVNEPRYHRLL